MVRREDRVQAGIGFSPEEVDIIMAAGGGDNLVASCRALIADGLRWRMRHLAQKPLSTFTLLATRDGAMIDLYRQFSDAVASEIGTVGPLGNVCKLVATQERIAEASETVYDVVQGGNE